MASAPPAIFSPARRAAVRRRLLAAQQRPGAARYVLTDMIEDVVERLAFLQHRPGKSLVIGDWSGALAATLDGEVSDAPIDFADELPFAASGCDFIASLGRLDTVNDLPGALIHIRSALAPGGLAIASFVGAGSLPALRTAMLAADGERPAPRLHPAVDVRSGGLLLQRTGWADPVVDSRTIEVRFANLGGLVGDLRVQGLSNVLARSGPPLRRPALTTATDAFGERTLETFEIITLTGWKR